MARTGQGTINWTAAEKAELLARGKVSGYQGHHINSVNGHPEMAGDPNNIKFVKGSAGNLAEHEGSFRNPTEGPLIDRAMNRSLIAIQVAQMVVAFGLDYRINKNEAKTGLHSDAISGLQVTDVDKAGKTLKAGTVGNFEGSLFMLGKDGKWRNERGDTLYHDRDGNHVQRVMN